MKRGVTALVAIALAATMGSSTAGAVANERTGADVPGTVLAKPELSPPASPAWAEDAPDPDVVGFGSTFYAYTTGTTWGNYLGVLESSAPTVQWHAIAGERGSSALPNPPAWQDAGSETSPSVAKIGDRYVMYYDSLLKSDTSLYCLSVATASSPAGPFTDDSTGPFGPCSAKWKGTIDPDVVTVGAGHDLLWKELDSGVNGSAQIFSEPLSANGLSLVGKAKVLLTQDSAKYTWETTTENPALTFASGTWWLLFSAGSWTNSSYSEAYVRCDGPAGPCGTAPTRILTSYGKVHGPGGATTFEESDGVWYLDFAAWTSPCTHESSGCYRELYIAPIEFATIDITTRSLGKATAGKSYSAKPRATGGLGPRTWKATGLPSGLRIASGTGQISGTPASSGTYHVTVSASTSLKSTQRSSKSFTLTVAS